MWLVRYTAVGIVSTFLLAVPASAEQTDVNSSLNRATTALELAKNSLAIANAKLTEARASMPVTPLPDVSPAAADSIRQGLANIVGVLPSERPAQAPRAALAPARTAEAPPPIVQEPLPPPVVTAEAPPTPVPAVAPHPAPSAATVVVPPPSPGEPTTVTVTTPPQRFDFTPIAIAFVGGLFSVVGLVATAWINARLKDQQDAATLGNAIRNSLGAMQNAIETGLKSHPLQAAIPGITAPQAEAVRYVIDHAGDEMARLGITSVAVADKIIARIGLTDMPLVTPGAPPSPKAAA